MTLMSPEQAGARHALLYFTFRNRIRATGITTYLDSAETLESTQHVIGHEVPPSPVSASLLSGFIAPLHWTSHRRRSWGALWLLAPGLASA